MRLHYYRETNDSEPELVSVREAKKLMKEKGGVAWTEHYDRDGGMFETSKITTGNNAKTAYNVKYNIHL